MKQTFREKSGYRRFLDYAHILMESETTGPSSGCKWLFQKGCCTGGPGSGLTESARRSKRSRTWPILIYRRCGSRRISPSRVRSSAYP
ncbi:uncharacterized protein LOC116845914 isoform X6 [Odontomachus brunneus]|uniref:uncharacterized protein LOC116845914 isoform X6 n=1 Tax=Odontomachus brunneus TaxID=486640 RepID=UPI0013F1D70B|nr:uncharacterized protein LOC116845914 isoform X6 [Odontomachus brunneus]